jgi:hypothetical protein
MGEVAAMSTEQRADDDVVPVSRRALRSEGIKPCVAGVGRALSH